MDIFDAATLGNLQRVMVLVEHDAGLVHADEDGYTPLMRAALAGRVEVARYLLDHDADVNRRDTVDRSPALHWACVRGHSAVVMVLLRSSAEVDATSDEGYTAMHYACAEGHADILVQLLEAGADPFIRRILTRTAFTVASYTVDQACIRILQEWIARIFCRGSPACATLRQLHRPMPLSSKTCDL